MRHIALHDSGIQHLEMAVFIYKTTELESLHYSSDVQITNQFLLTSYIRTPLLESARSSLRSLVLVGCGRFSYRGSFIDFENQPCPEID